MKFQYAGPKPLISAHGIEFDHNKEDKYVYLSIVAELIEALDHEYVDNRRYTYLAVAEPLDTDKVFSLILSKDPSLKSEIEERKKIAENEIADELERARTNRVINEEEREVLLRNIELLRNYQINRAINKTVYYCGINIIAAEIKKEHVDFIQAPMFPKFFHVFHSIQGVLNKLHPPVDSKLEIREHEGELKVILEFNFNR